MIDKLSNIKAEDVNSTKEVILICQQAKAMEKEQIVKAVDSNFNYDNNGYPTLGEQYYNETYGNTNSN